MKRRDFTRIAALAGVGVLLQQRELWATREPRAAIILRGAAIYDGTGARPLEGDVAIDADRITAVGRRLNVAGAHIIDLRGLALADRKSVV